MDNETTQCRVPLSGNDGVCTWRQTAAAAQWNKWGSMAAKSVPTWKQGHRLQAAKHPSEVPQTWASISELPDSPVRDKSCYQVKCLCSGVHRSHRAWESSGSGDATLIFLYNLQLDFDVVEKNRLKILSVQNILDMQVASKIKSPNIDGIKSPVGLPDITVSSSKVTFLSVQWD